MTKVNELRRLLLDFEQKNKEHFQRGRINSSELGKDLRSKDQQVKSECDDPRFEIRCPPNSHSTSAHGVTEQEQASEGNRQQSFTPSPTRMRAYTLEQSVEKNVDTAGAPEFELSNHRKDKSLPFHVKGERTVNGNELHHSRQAKLTGKENTNERQPKLALDDERNGAPAFQLSSPRKNKSSLFHGKGERTIHGHELDHARQAKSIVKENIDMRQPKLAVDDEKNVDDCDAPAFALSSHGKSNFPLGHGKGERIFQGRAFHHFRQVKSIGKENTDERQPKLVVDDLPITPTCLFVDDVRTSVEHEKKKANRSRRGSTEQKSIQAKSPMRRLQNKLPLLLCKSGKSGERSDESQCDVPANIDAHTHPSRTILRDEKYLHYAASPASSGLVTFQNGDSSAFSALKYNHNWNVPFSYETDDTRFITDSITALQTKEAGSQSDHSNAQERPGNPRKWSMATFLQDTNLLSTDSVSTSESSSGLNALEDIDHHSSNDDQSSTSSRSSTDMNAKYKTSASEICHALTTSSCRRTSSKHVFASYESRLSKSSLVGARLTENSLSGAKVANITDDVVDNASVFSARSLSEISSTAIDRKKFLQEVMQKTDIFKKKPNTSTQDLQSKVKKAAGKFGGCSLRKRMVEKRREELECRWSATHTQSYKPQTQWQARKVSGSYNKKVVLVAQKNDPQEAI